MNARPRIVPRPGPSLHWPLALAAAAALGLAAPAGAQLPLPASSQFDLTGFIQAASLDPACSADPHCGGTLTVNGHLVVIPRETIVILPANALSWQELFAQAPAPYGLAGAAGPSTGLALTDLPQPIATYEVNVIGNRVIGPAGDRYIAGLVHISQQDLNSGAGFINYIDYAGAELRVGGVIGDPTTGARVRINDPVGRFGVARSEDPRFCVDDANPTIAASTGFPMCLPRTDPLAADDPRCPQGNRPLGASLFTMNDPALQPGFPDPRLQAPMLVGDYVTFTGTLVSDDASQPTVKPAAGVGTYVSAHTIIDNAGIYTAPGANPAYLSIEVGLIGTGGLNVLGAGEAVIRTRFEGMTTDPTRNVHLYGVDYDPRTGTTSDRDFGTIGADPGAPVGAVKGRWRFRPPCLAFGTVPTKPDKQCVMNALGVFLPPPRELRAVIEGLQGQNPAVAGATTAANGIFWGQYHAPIGEYIFPENIPGTPIPPNNFETIQFLAQGGYPSAGGTLGRQLNPWPGAVAPAPACTVPVAGAGNPQSVPFGSRAVLLSGSAVGTAPLDFAWTASAGVLTGAATATPSLDVSALPAGAVVNLTLVVTGCGTTSTATTTVTVNAPAAPVLNAIASVTALSGQAVTLTASGTAPPPGPLTFTWRQTGGPAAVIASPTGAASIAFTRAVPAGQVTPDVFTFTVTGTANGVTSGPQTVTVTVNPRADAVIVTSTQYRTSKQRLVITATSSVVSPNVVLTLRPYTTTSGAAFDPTALGSVFTNTGGGLYTLTLVGAPQPAAPPAVLTVVSNLGGSGTLILQSVRP